MFFFNDTATTEIYTLSLHDALPIWPGSSRLRRPCGEARFPSLAGGRPRPRPGVGAVIRASASGPSRPAGAVERSEEHTSELQSRQYLVCRLLLEKKKVHIQRFPSHT